MTSLVRIASFDALLGAFRRARREKRGRGGEPAFAFQIESHLLALGAALRDGSWRPDPYRYFHLRTRKDRIVSEASFRDRVVHHALVAALEPAFEPHFSPFSYACRAGFGQHAALERVRRLARRHAYALRLDVRRYFDHVRHPVLLGLLERGLSRAGPPDGGLVRPAWSSTCGRRTRCACGARRWGGWLAW